MFKLDLEKAKEPVIKLPTSAGSQKKQEFQKNIYFCFIDNAKALTFKQTVENSSRDENTRPLTCLLRNLYAGQEATIRTRHGTRDWFHMGKEFIKSLYCHPVYLNSMQNT